MSGSVYTFLGPLDSRIGTAAIETSQGIVLKGQSGLFLSNEVEAARAQELDLVAGPAVSPASQLTAPTVAAGSSGGLTGTYRYVVTFVTAAGETKPSNEVSVTLSSQEASLSNLPLGNTTSGVIARNLYRTAANGSSGSEKLVGTINDNTTTTAVDNLADGSLGAAVPTSDTSAVIGGSSIAPQIEFAELTGDPSDDVYAISAGTGEKVATSGSSISAGSGLTKSGTTISADFGSTSGTVAAGDDPRFIPAWAASTSYTAGDQVINPSSQLVERISTGTSASTWSADSSNWQAPGTGSGSLTVTDGTTSVAGATEIDFTSGATVTKSGTTAQVAISGGSASSVSSPNGTINVTDNAGDYEVDVVYGTAANTAAQGDDSRITGALQAANDLSDVASASTALGNLGGAPLASPVFTGTPEAPTPTAGDNSTKLATTAFVETAVAGVTTPAPSGPGGTAGANTGSAVTIASPTSFNEWWGVMNAATVTVTMPTATAGALFQARFDQDTTGGRVLAFASNPTFPGYASATAALAKINAQSAASGHIWITFVCVDGTTWEAFPVLPQGRSVIAVTSGASITPAITGPQDHIFVVSALAAAMTINAPTGSPVDGQKIMFRLAQSGQLAAPSAPAPTTATTGGTVAAGTYTVAVTYVDAGGETVASATGTVTTTGTTSTITIPSPAASGDATGWYAYVSQAGASTPLYRQQAAGSPTTIGTALTLTAPPTTTGATAPASNTSGGGHAITWNAAFTTTSDIITWPSQPTAASAAWKDGYEWNAGTSKWERLAMV